MWLSIACCTWFSGRLDTHDGSWFCQTRLCPRTRMPCALANDTTPSPGPKLYDPLDGSVVSHFISLPGVTMSNCWPARFVIVELLTMFPVTSVPKYLPCASAAARSVLPAAVAGTAAASDAARHAGSRRHRRRRQHLLTRPGGAGGTAARADAEPLRDGSDGHR